MADTDFSYTLDVKGNVVKRDKDLTREADRVINLSNGKVSENKFEDALIILLNFEKEARNAADLPSYIKVILHLLDIHAKLRLWDRLVEIVNQLSKRRGQFKQAIVEIVQLCMTYLDSIDDYNIRLKFIKNLCQISENKIYVENERARLLMILSKGAESEDKIGEALSFICDLGVESYGTMSNDEKNEIMLEQVRLCINNNDIIRAQIISKRIHSSTIDEKTNPNLKHKYYHTIMRLKFLEKKYVEFTQLGLACTSLPVVNSNPEILYPMLKTVLISLFMCSFDQTRQDLSSRITQHRNFIEMAYLKNILENFMADEIIDWSSIELLYGEKIKDFLSPSSCPYVTDVKEATFMYDLLHSRVNEHNLKVVYKCYSQISVFRLAQVLNLSIEEAETALCQAVYSKVIFARINRPKKVIVFKPNLSPPHILNAYLERIEVLFLNIGHVATLINKEYNKAELTNKVVKA